MCYHVTASVCRLPATSSCAESVPFVHSSLQVRPQLSSVLEFYLGLITSLMAGITSDQMARLQRIQNNSARRWYFTFFIKKKRSEHVTPLLISPFQWLPIKQPIEYTEFAMLTGFSL